MPRETPMAVHWAVEDHAGELEPTGMATGVQPNGTQGKQASKHNKNGTTRTGILVDKPRSS
jgi:hypothetical protein